MNWKENIRNLTSRFVVSTGVTKLARRFFMHSGSLILCGHRVGPDDGLRPERLSPVWLMEQVAYLRGSSNPISLTRLLDWFEGGPPVPSRSVVLTFDDGFSDNLEYLLPIAKKYGIPFCVFLTTECMTSGKLPWPQRLSYILMRTEVKRCKYLSLPQGTMELSSYEQRESVWKVCLGVLQRQEKSLREQTLAEMEQELEVSPPRDAMLSWDQARSMLATGLVEFGCHTFSHPWMEYLSEKEARWEMEKSKADLKEQLGIDKPSFCFPGGSRTPGLVAMAKKLGFRSVFQSRPELRYNSPRTTHQFALSRIGLPNAPSYVLEAELDGIFHPIRRLYRSVR